MVLPESKTVKLFEAIFDLQSRKDERRTWITKRRVAVDGTKNSAKIGGGRISRIPVSHHLPFSSDYVLVIDPKTAKSLWAECTGLRAYINRYKGYFTVTTFKWRVNRVCGSARYEKASKMLQEFWKVSSKDIRIWWSFFAFARKEEEVGLEYRRYSLLKFGCKIKLIFVMLAVESD